MAESHLGIQVIAHTILNNRHLRVKVQHRLQVFFTQIRDLNSSGNQYGKGLVIPG